MSFDNGSIANISYFSNGNKDLAKEHIEIFCNGIVAIIDDFRKLTIYSKRKKILKGKQDKGHAEELKQFISSIKKGTSSPIPFDELYISTQASFKVLESIHNGRKIQLG